MKPFFPARMWEQERRALTFIWKRRREWGRSQRILLYAAETAKKAGFYVVGVYDENSCKTAEEKKRLEDVSDEIIENWEEF